MLKNRFYIGEIVYRGEVHRGEQGPMLKREDGVRCRKPFEPVSGPSRTGLWRTKTEIGKWRAETAAVKPAGGALEFEVCRANTLLAA